VSQQCHWVDRSGAACWKIRGHGYDSHKERDHPGIGRRIQTANAKQQAADCPSEGNAEEQPDPHSCEHALAGQEKDRPHDISPSGAKSQTNSEFAVSMRHIKTDEAEKTNRCEHQGKGRKDREHPDAEAPWCDGPRHDGVHRRQAVDDHSWIQAASLRLNRGCGASRIT
jgi:hypothetical protein